MITLHHAAGHEAVAHKALEKAKESNLGARGSPLDHLVLVCFALCPPAAFVPRAEATALAVALDPKLA